MKKQKPIPKSDPPMQYDQNHLHLPEPEEMPAIEDDGKKPPLSYAMLIGQSILRAPNRRLTLNSIYKWISSSFKFYDSVESGWQNSIRHNLSLNKAFYKQERPKDDPGKGNYWAITPGMESQFLKEQPRRSMSKAPSFIYQDQSDAIRPSTSSSNMGFPSERSLSKIDSSKFPEETELSSDATIPASDPAIHDGIDPDNQAMPPPSRNIRSSPPPADIRSSPPPGATEGVDREDTPPPAARTSTSSRPSGGRKRKFMASTGGLGDSGYYSSIESSATRNNARGHFLTPEADHDHPTMKRGRAEEEIARIRSSSFDSPSKTRPNLQQPAAAFPSSSPFRPFEQQTSKGPLTPAVIFKKPARPPMSVSPNTNLRNHREHVRQLLGSPDKSLGLMDSTFSPFPFPASLELPNAELFEIYSGEPVNFDVFTDDSPLKSAKRPLLKRANTTSSVLADITGAGSNRVPHLSRPDFKPVRLASPVRMTSPAKRSLASLPTSHPNMALPQIPEEDDYLFGVELPSDDSETGLDLTQGFQKIGAPASASPHLARNAGMLAPPSNWSRATGSPSKPPGNGRGNARPVHGRSMTSIW
jgi:forkhead transcription factor HCM1